MTRRGLIAIVLVTAALLGVGVVLGSSAFQRTTTTVLVETRTLTVGTSPSTGQTLHVQLLDYEPRQAGAASDTPFPLGECEANTRFPRIENITVHDATKGRGEGTLVGLPDSATLGYSPIADAGEEGICVMQFDVPDLAPSRFYIVHADSDELFDDGYSWRLSAAELERDGWSVNLRLSS